MALTPAERARYSRHLTLAEIGVTGQEKLRAARVLIVGAGGLGSPAALYLAAAGVGTIGLADGDRVDLSNLQRQILFGTADVGSEKNSAGRARLLQLNPNIAVVVHGELHAADILDIIAGYDIVIDGSDRFATRYLVNDACVLARIPLVSAAIHRFEGQALTYVPEQGPCYRCLFPDPPDPGTVPNCVEAGVLGVLPGVMGTLQATEALKLIVGIGEPLLGRLLTYDALRLRFDEFKCERRSGCRACGMDPAIRSAEDLLRLHGGRGSEAGDGNAGRRGEGPEKSVTDNGNLRAARRLSPRELQALLRGEESREWQLIDVREPYEFDAGHLAGAVNMPLTELPGKLAASQGTQGLSQGMVRGAEREAADIGTQDAIRAATRIDLEGATLGEVLRKKPLFMCRSGARSLRACELAERAGVSALGHLEGGLSAWAAEIDPALVVADVA